MVAMFPKLSNKQFPSNDIMYQRFKDSKSPIIHYNNDESMHELTLKQKDK